MVPGAPEVTVIAIWQLTPGLSVATFNRTLASPTALAKPLVLVTVPHEAGVNVAVVLASVSPAGKVSGNCTAVTAPGLPAGLVKVSESEALVPAAILAGEIVFVAVAGAYTPRVWVATPLTRPVLVVTSLGPLVVVPLVTPRTVSVMVQAAFAATSTPKAVKV